MRKELNKQQKKSKEKDRDTRAKEADKILIPKFPTPEKYRDWKIKVRDNIAAGDKKGLWYTKGNKAESSQPSVQKSHGKQREAKATKDDRARSTGPKQTKARNPCGLFLCKASHRKIAW